MQVTGESRRTITENAANVVTKERRFHIYEVLLQDVLDGTNIAHPKMVILKTRSVREVARNGGNVR
jgi:hypothetical protein